MKTIEQHFYDWFSGVFEYGYGSGDEPMLVALRDFMTCCKPPNGSYDYRDLEAKMGKIVTWLMINTLCHAGIIEYGTSPRFGWLTPQGNAVRTYLCDRPWEQVTAAYETIQTMECGDYVSCFPDHCNCEEGHKCANPFFKNKQTKVIKMQPKEQ